MKKTKPMGIAALSNTTDQSETTPISKEMQEMHDKLKREYLKACQPPGLRKSRTRGHREAEEVARANLRAFERKNGLTS